MLPYFLEMAGQLNHSANTVKKKKYCFGFAELGELVMTELDITPNKVQLSKKKVSAGFSLRNRVAG